MLRIVAPALLMIVVAAAPARAELIDFGNGLIGMRNGTIYDSVQDVTWLQDVNYARTSGADEDGLMLARDAYVWVNSLVFAGSSDWRLPRVNTDGLYENSDSEVSTLMGMLGRHWQHLPLQICDASGCTPTGEYSESLDYAGGTWGPFVGNNAAIPSFWLESTPTTNAGCGMSDQYPVGCTVWQSLYNVEIGVFHSEYHAVWANRDGGDPRVARVPEPSTLVMTWMGIAGILFGSFRATRDRLS